jgi:hypothetical protein
MELAELIQILQANKEKPFIKRIIDPAAYPRLPLEGGDYATHKMAWGESDGKPVVFPTVMMDNGQLTDFGDSAFSRAMETGNYVEFDDPQRAEDFSKTYKQIWANPGGATMPNEQFMVNQPDNVFTPEMVQRLMMAQRMQRMQQQQALVQALMSRYGYGQGQSMGGGYGPAGGGSGAYAPQSFMQPEITGPGTQDYGFRPTANAAQFRNPNAERNAYWGQEDQYLDAQTQSAQEQQAFHQQQAALARQREAQRQAAAQMGMQRGSNFAGAAAPFYGRENPAQRRMMWQEPDQTDWSY